MKLKSTGFFILIISLTFFGCIGNNAVNPTSNNAPSGTFTGKFALLHLNSKTGIIDTTLANLVLSMQSSSGFKVTGDTTVVHAGSYGSYLVNSTYTSIEFIDLTYPKTAKPTKTHLNGIYDYTYDGTNLHIAAYSPLDTLALVYNLKRTGN